MAAHDFGYIGTLEFAERLRFTLATLEKLEKYRGHLLNWYDTQTLAPRYISTVDSGNLAGHLLAVKQSIIEISNRPLFDQRLVDGLRDTAELLREAAAQLNAVRQSTEAVTVKQLRGEIAECVALLETPPDETPAAWTILLESLTAHLEILTDITGALAQEHGDAAFSELRFWTTSLARQTQAFRRDIETFVPWKDQDFAQLATIIDRDFPDIKPEWRETEDLFTLGLIPRQLAAALYYVNERVHS